MTKINVIDIGAIGGFDRPWNKHQDKIEWSLSFEPNDTPILTGKHLRYDCAVWSFDGEANFYVSGFKGTGSSILKQNYDWVRNNFDKIKLEGNEQLNKSWFERSQITKEFKCSVRKLDSVLADLYHRLNQKISFQFLKSDTQSGEFFVLEGARSYLEEDCLGLELELYRYPLYEGIILEDEVKNYLNQLGFSVAGRTPYQYSFKSQADYLFLRQNPRTLEEKQIIDLILSIYQPQGENKLIKQVSLKERLFNKSKMMLKKFI